MAEVCGRVYWVHKYVEELFLGFQSVDSQVFLDNIKECLTEGDLKTFEMLLKEEFDPSLPKEMLYLGLFHRLTKHQNWKQVLTKACKLDSELGFLEDRVNHLIICEEIMRTLSRTMGVVIEEEEVRKAFQMPMDVVKEDTVGEEGQSTASGKKIENRDRLCILMMTVCVDLFQDVLEYCIQPKELLTRLHGIKGYLESNVNTKQRRFLEIYMNHGLLLKTKDLSLLYILLRFFCNIPPPKLGLGRHQENNNKIFLGSIENLRILRKRISDHLEEKTDIHESEFKDILTKFRTNIAAIQTMVFEKDTYAKAVDALFSLEFGLLRTERYFQDFQQNMDDNQHLQPRCLIPITRFFWDILSNKVTNVKDKLSDNLDHLKTVLNDRQFKLVHQISKDRHPIPFNDDLDVPLLYILLRKICNIPPHNNGWGLPPEIDDQSLAACIERIRIYASFLNGQFIFCNSKNPDFQIILKNIGKDIDVIKMQGIKTQWSSKTLEEFASLDLNLSKHVEYEREDDEKIKDSKSTIESQMSSELDIKNECVSCVSFCESALRALMSENAQSCSGEKITVIPENTEQMKTGTILIFEVDVIWRDKQIKVNERDSAQKEHFFKIDSSDTTRVIWVYSKSVRVIDAKLSVYKKYEHDMESKDILLHHDYEEEGEMIKRSRVQKLASSIKDVLLIRQYIPTEKMESIIQNTIENELSHERIRDICYKVSQDSRIKTEDAFFLFWREQPVIEIARMFAEKISSEIIFAMKNCKELKTKINYNEMKNEIKAKFTPFLHPIVDILTPTSSECIDLCLTADDRNLEDVLKSVADGIFANVRERRIVDEILPLLRYICTQTQNDLLEVSKRINEDKNKIVLQNGKELIHEWEMRKVIPNSNECVEKFPSVLKYIAGRKNEALVVKVFFSYEDRDAENYFKEQTLVDESEFDFINVRDKLCKSTSLEKDDKKEKDLLPPPMDKTTRQKLGEIINDRGMKLFANYSNITCISPGYMSKGTWYGKPCIVLHCLDDTLIPFGEKTLPEKLDGYPVDVREGLVTLANCRSCESLTHGCCIELPDGSWGSLGIFVQKNRIDNSPLNGFLTAAHVALAYSHCEDLYNNSDVHEFRDDTNPIYHQTSEPYIIGTVREAFFGNLNGVGIDAAFVEIHNIEHEHFRLQIVDEDDLTYGLSKVTKTGGVTGNTTGILSNMNVMAGLTLREDCSICFPFYNCFEISNNNHQFFANGDSGSGVFLCNENGIRTNKAIGIGVAIRNNSTLVCNIREIVRAFNIDVSEQD